MSLLHIDLNTQRGSILLAVVLTLVLASLGGLLVNARRSLLRSSQAQQHSLLADLDSSSAGLVKAATAASPKRFTCSLTDSVRGLAKIYRSTCGLYASVNSISLHQSNIDFTGIAFDKLPLFELNSIFKSSQLCPSQYTSVPQHAASGYLLSSSAYVSKRTCIALPPPPLASSLTLSGNLEIQSLQLPPSAMPNIVAVSGFFDIAGELIAPSSTLIIALGDIHISKLNSSSAVTLLSLSGAIKVDSSSGFPKLKTIAALGSQLPAFTYQGDNGLYPPNRLFQALYLKPAKEY